MSEQGASARGRVVIADDSPDHRVLLRMMLEAAGFVIVGEARNGEEAVALVEEQRPQAIVLDLGMPVLDGRRAIPLLKQRAPGTVILVVSASRAYEVADEVVALGADGYLEKGTPSAELVARLRELCAGGEARPA